MSLTLAPPPIAPPDPDDWQSGDVLLYAPCAFSWRHLVGWVFGRLIAARTWHDCAHVEVFIGRTGLSLAVLYTLDKHFGERTQYAVASRNGEGVNIYALRLDGLIRVRRPPIGAVDLPMALAWFWSARGQVYDWFGLLRFVTTGKVGQRQDDKQFCSEFAARWYAKGGFLPFGDEDADAIAPFQFDCTRLLSLVWSRDRRRADDAVYAV